MDVILGEPDEAQLAIRRNMQVASIVIVFLVIIDREYGVSVRIAPNA